MAYLLAERMGFEPMKELLLYTLSKRAPSTTRPPLQYYFHVIYNIIKKCNMNFIEYKKTLRYKNYSNIKIFFRYVEYVTKNILINLIIKLNFFVHKPKRCIDLGSFKDNRFINFLIYALKDDFIFLYKNDENTKKLFHRIGLLNFFRYTGPNVKFNNQTKLNFVHSKNETNINKICFNTNYFKYFYDNNEIKKEQMIMPYYMYPRIYNSFYNKIYSKKKTKFQFKNFFFWFSIRRSLQKFLLEKRIRKIS